MAPASKRKADDDFVFTISDDEAGFPDEEVEEEESAVNEKKRKREGGGKKSKKRRKGQKEQEDEDEAPAGQDDGAIDPDFEFQLADGTAALEDFDGWMTNGTGGKIVKRAVDIDEIIARRLKPQEDGVEKSVNGSTEDKVEEDEFEGLDEEEGDDELLAEDAFGMGVEMDGENESDEEDEDEQDGSDRESGDEEDEEEGSDDEVAEHVPHPDDVASDSEAEPEEEDAVEKERQRAFFAPESNLDGEKDPSHKVVGSFQEMSLSRPIIKGLSSVGFAAPTPIQHKTIPVALLGKDVVGGAQTGSGKTGAFIIPILERLLYRPKKVATTRVAILMPTRELALQCYTVATKLASFTDITFGQAIGGMNAREQENALKQRPDVVIATPGRFIDFMRNSSSFDVSTIEILVLDEADRMLEDGFADELNEILTTIPKSRQTMLFSATMTSSVDSLIRVGLNRPVRLLVDAKRQTVAGLTQEFVRLRPGREDKRLGYLLYLCKNVFTTRTIIFFRQKKEAHRVRIIFGLLGLKAAELHGSMSQEQRINAIEAFRSENAAFLLATDLASRGLDIKNVETVINYEAPQSHEIYLHRVGRTARAGRSGRSCTIAAEPDRKVVKAAVKTSREQGAIIKSRVIAPADADQWSAKVEAMEEEIEAVLKEEKEEKVMATAEMQMRRAENVMEHEKEILARPKKTWFQGQKDKQEASARGKAALNNMELPEHGTKMKKKKLSNKEKKKLEDKDERAEGLWRKGKSDRGKSGPPPARGGKKSFGGKRGGKK
ncbi:nucleolar DEAD-box protein required for synthesis of 60S ribosomal subunit [Zalaria obscura]|uniref:Nucleolar DEAD-box protein required for synthesis of 60S ribosomal subunit n=1 Tax=Zalaria obscura TaxID=2024903 RepID=A0ACC3S3Q0_9PEZI